MRLSKNKIVKLLNGKNQSRKKIKYNRNHKKKNRNSFRKKKPLNLRLRTLKHHKKNSVIVHDRKKHKNIYIGGDPMATMISLGEQYISNIESTTDKKAFINSLVTAMKQQPPTPTSPNDIIKDDLVCNELQSVKDLLDKDSSSEFGQSSSPSVEEEDEAQGAAGRRSPLSLPVLPPPPLPTNPANQPTLPTPQDDCVSDVDKDDGIEKIKEALTIVKQSQNARHTLDPNHGVDDTHLPSNVVEGRKICNDNRDIVYDKDKNEFTYDGNKITDIDLRNKNLKELDAKQAKTARESELLYKQETFLLTNIEGLKIDVSNMDSSKIYDTLEDKINRIVNTILTLETQYLSLVEQKQDVAASTPIEESTKKKTGFSMPTFRMKKKSTPSQETSSPVINLPLTRKQIDDKLDETTILLNLVKYAGIMAYKYINAMNKAEEKPEEYAKVICQLIKLQGSSDDSNEKKYLVIKTNLVLISELDCKKRDEERDTILNRLATNETQITPELLERATKFLHQGLTHHDDDKTTAQAVEAYKKAKGLSDTESVTVSGGGNTQYGGFLRDSENLCITGQAYNIQQEEKLITNNPECNRVAKEYYNKYIKNSLNTVNSLDNKITKLDIIRAIKKNIALQDARMAALTRNPVFGQNLNISVPPNCIKDDVTAFMFKNAIELNNLAKYLFLTEGELVWKRDKLNTIFKLMREAGSIPVKGYGPDVGVKSRFNVFINLQTALEQDEEINKTLNDDENNLTIIKDALSDLASINDYSNINTLNTVIVSNMLGLTNPCGDSSAYPYPRLRASIQNSKILLRHYYNTFSIAGTDTASGTKSRVYSEKVHDVHMKSYNKAADLLVSESDLTSEQKGEVQQHISRLKETKDAHAVKLATELETKLRQKNRDDEERKEIIKDSPEHLKTIIFPYDTYEESEKQDTLEKDVLYAALLQAKSSTETATTGGGTNNVKPTFGTIGGGDSNELRPLHEWPTQICPIGAYVHPSGSSENIGKKKIASLSYYTGSDINQIILATALLEEIINICYEKTKMKDETDLQGYGAISVSEGEFVQGTKMRGSDEWGGGALVAQQMNNANAIQYYEYSKVLIEAIIHNKTKDQSYLMWKNVVSSINTQSEKDNRKAKNQPEIYKKVILNNKTQKDNIENIESIANLLKVLHTQKKNMQVSGNVGKLLNMEETPKKKEFAVQPDSDEMIKYTIPGSNDKIEFIYNVVTGNTAGKGEEEKITYDNLVLQGRAPQQGGVRTSTENPTATTPASSDTSAASTNDNGDKVIKLLDKILVEIYNKLTGRIQRANIRTSTREDRPTNRTEDEAANDKEVDIVQIINKHASEDGVEPQMLYSTVKYALQAINHRVEMSRHNADKEEEEISQEKKDNQRRIQANTLSNKKELERTLAALKAKRQGNETVTHAELHKKVEALRKMGRHDIADEIIKGQLGRKDSQSSLSDSGVSNMFVLQVDDTSPSKSLVVWGPFTKDSYADTGGNFLDALETLQNMPGLQRKSAGTRFVHPVTLKDLNVSSVPDTSQNPVIPGAPPGVSGLASGLAAPRPLTPGAAPVAPVAAPRAAAGLAAPRPYSLRSSMPVPAPTFAAAPVTAPVTAKASVPPSEAASLPSTAKPAAQAQAKPEANPAEKEKKKTGGRSKNKTKRKSKGKNKKTHKNIFKDNQPNKKNRRK